jgi:hypothetical protein
VLDIEPQVDTGWLAQLNVNCLWCAVASRPVPEERSGTPSKPATGTSVRAVAKEIREASCGNHKRRIFVFANPKSGSGKASKVVPWMQTFLHRAELAEVTVHYTRFR